MQTPARTHLALSESPDSANSEPPPTDWFLPYVENPVSLLAYKLAGRTNLYEDLRQEGLHAACQAVHSFRPDAGAALGTYALRCARNRMLDYLKRERRITQHTISGDEPVNDNDETLLDTLAYQPRSFETPDTALLLGRLQQALLALPLRESAFIRLSFYEEVPQAEIAVRFSITRARVGQVLEQAIHRLRKTVG
jgi:RNA polymerase sigma factor (sigma-70 family)